MKNLWKALCMVHRCAPRSFWLRVVYVVLQSVLPLVNLFILKGLIDSVTAGIGQGGYGLQVMWLIVTMCLVFLLNRIVSALNGINNDVLSQRLVDYISDQLQRQSARLDMQYYDNPAYYDSLHRAQQESSFRPLQILSNFMSVGGALISVAGVVAMLAAASWWVIVVMIVAVLPGFAVRLYKARRIYRFRRENTQLYRRTGYYGAVLTSRDYAKEMRAYRLAPFFRQRFVQLRRQLTQRLLRISRRLGMLDIICSLIEVVAMFSVLWILVSRTWAGAVTIGTFVMLFEAFRRGQGYLSSLVNGVAALYDSRLFVANLFEFLELKPTIVAPDDPLPMPESITHVEFRDVTFRYPDMDRDVLSHFSLQASKGHVVRIDGRNGFGKSTLIKLLLRLYDPQQGSILINGVDIRSFDPVALRARMGVLFQDFVRFNLTVAENVSIGHVDGDPDVAQSLALSGAGDFVSRLPLREQTPLGRLFDGGAELSMGQWQRLALARALASDAPLLLLDEPTAWLDADARGRLEETLRELKDEKIILLITHSQTMSL